MEYKWGDIAIISCHTSTEDKEDQTKDVFYNQLKKRVYDNIPYRTRKIIIRDLNAKMGKEPIFKHTIGEYSLHEMSNDNGEKPISLAISKNMTISSLYFPHKKFIKKPGFYLVYIKNTR